MALTRVAGLPRRGARVAADRLTTWRLERSSSEKARQVATAARAVARNEFSDESLRWFERIETLRTELAASTERVETVDYGAGLPTSTRTDEEMYRGAVNHPQLGGLARTASLPAALGRFLHAVVRATGTRRGLELGTCLGISAAYQASALDHNDGASFVTCEGASALAERAATNLRQLGLGRCRVVPGRFADTLAPVAAEQEPIDYAFIDGHHDQRATVRYFEILRPHLAPSAAIVFDDIRWSAGMTRAWRIICASPGVAATMDRGRLGVVIVEERGAD